MSVLFAATCFVMTKILNLITNMKHARIVRILITTQTPRNGKKVGVQHWKRLEKMELTDIRALGNLIDTSFGRSSSPGGGHSIKAVMSGDNLSVVYTTVVHFASEASLQQQVIAHKEEGTQRTLAYIKELKKDFRAETGKTLKIGKEEPVDDVELISATSNSARKIAYYKMKWMLSLG